MAWSVIAVDPEYRGFHASGRRVGNYRFCESAGDSQRSSCLTLRAGKIDGDAPWVLDEAAQRRHSAGDAGTSETSRGLPEEVVPVAMWASHGHLRRQALIPGGTTTLVRPGRVQSRMFR